MLFTSSVQKLDPPLTQKLGDSVKGLPMLLKMISPFSKSEDYLTQGQLNMQVNLIETVNSE